MFFTAENTTFDGVFSIVSCDSADLRISAGVKFLPGSKWYPKDLPDGPTILEKHHSKGDVDLILTQSHGEISRCKPWWNKEPNKPPTSPHQALHPGCSLIFLVGLDLFEHGVRAAFSTGTCNWVIAERK